MSERWLPVVGWEGLYQISTNGRVWSEITQRYLKPWLVNGKKLQVELCRPRRHRYIHDLMLEAFVGPRPEGLEGCHWNDVGIDNRIENLRWDTHSANVADGVRNKIHPESKRTHCPKKHEYTPENTRVYRGKRFCRKCKTIRNKEQRMLFRNNTHQEMWRQRWCETCFQPEEAARRLQGKDTQCPIWKRALHTNRKAPEWDRNNRTDELWRTIKCNSYTSKPPIIKRAKAVTEDVPLFDETPYKVDVGFVPVEGWPDRPQKDGVDHQ